jgi:hypothetical protein
MGKKMEDKNSSQDKAQIWKRWHQIMQHKNCAAAHESVTFTTV